MPPVSYTHLDVYKRQDLDIAKTSVETFLNTVTINLGNTYAASQAVIPCMRQNGGGSIINISSISGLIPDNSQVAYGLSLIHI